MYKVVYKQGSFTDYKGTEVNFVLAAVSIPTNYVLVPVDEQGFELDDAEQVEVSKILSLGMAITRPEDNFDLEVGKKIAYNKAVGRRDHIFAVSDSGLVNTVMVNAVMEQEAAYMQINPGRYIAGYDDAKKKYFEAKAKEEYLSSLTAEEKLALNIVAKVKDHEKFLVAVEDKRKELTTGNTNAIGSYRNQATIQPTA